MKRILAMNLTRRCFKSIKMILLNISWAMMPARERLLSIKKNQRGFMLRDMPKVIRITRRLQISSLEKHQVPAWMNVAW